MNFKGDIDPPTEEFKEEPEEKKWIYLVIRGYNDNDIDLGKVYLTESIDSIKKKVIQSFGLQSQVKFSLTNKGKQVNGKTLGDLMLSPCEMFNEVVFHCDTTMNGGGLGGEIFIDIEGSKITQYNFGEAPKYRRVRKGLNFFGLCKNEKCEANEKTVYMQFGMGTFDYFKLVNDNKFLCPICKNTVRAESCGFWDCKYQIEGQGVKVKTSEFKTFSREGTAGKEHFDSFDTDAQYEDKVIYFKLKFVVNKKEK